MKLKLIKKYMSYRLTKLQPIANKYQKSQWWTYRKSTQSSHLSALPWLRFNQLNRRWLGKMEWYRHQLEKVAGLVVRHQNSLDLPFPLDYRIFPFSLSGKKECHSALSPPSCHCHHYNHNHTVRTIAHRVTVTSITPTVVQFRFVRRLSTVWSPMWMNPAFRHFRRAPVFGWAYQLSSTKWFPGMG